MAERLDTHFFGDGCDPPHDHPGHGDLATRTVCGECAAEVGNMARHLRWHRWLQRALKEGRRG